MSSSNVPETGGVGENVESQVRVEPTEKMEIGAIKVEGGAVAGQNAVSSEEHSSTSTVETETPRRKRGRPKKDAESTSSTPIKPKKAAKVEKKPKATPSKGVRKSTRGQPEDIEAQGEPETAAEVEGNENVVSGQEEPQGVTPAETEEELQADSTRSAFEDMRNSTV